MTPRNNTMNKHKPNGNRVIKKRRRITIEQKLEIIKKFESGLTKVKIEREFGLNEATVRAILKNADKYKRIGQTTSYALQCTRSRNVKMIEMERLLLKWIEESNQKQISLTTNVIKMKAFNLYATLKGDNDDSSFNASSGWFHRFKKRTGYLQQCDASEMEFNEIDIKTTLTNGSIPIPIPISHNIKEEECNIEDEGECERENEREEEEENHYDTNLDSPLIQITLKEYESLLRTVETLKQQILNLNPNLNRV